MFLGKEQSINGINFIKKEKIKIYNIVCHG